MPEYKLYYFEGRGRAELARQIFAAAGQKYENNRLSIEKFMEMKQGKNFSAAIFYFNLRK